MMKLALKIIAPLIILLASGYAFKVLKDSAPDPPSKKPRVVVPEARFIESSAADYAPPVRTFGTVSSCFETRLNAQVSGKIIGVSEEFRVGRIVKEGAHLVEIDSIDFEAALENQKAGLTLAKRALAEEEIRGKQALEDWIISGREVSVAPEYVLRKPQLLAAQADVQAARSAVEKAEADLKRALIVAPFDALVTERSASVGNLATPQSQMGTLVSTEKAEVFLPLTPSQVRRVGLPAKVTLSSSIYPDAKWSGVIVRTSPTISRDQVVTVIAEIPKPFETTPSLSIGSFVNAEITASELADVHRIPEAALVNDAYLWAIDSEQKLVRVDAERLHSDLGFTYVKLDRGELAEPLQVVERPLSNFESGLEVKPTAIVEK